MWFQAVLCVLCCVVWKKTGCVVNVSEYSLEYLSLYSRGGSRGLKLLNYRYGYVHKSATTVIIVTSLTFSNKSLTFPSETLTFHFSETFRKLVERKRFIANNAHIARLSQSHL
jgi:hypothetical protein